MTIQSLHPAIIFRGILMLWVLASSCAWADDKQADLVFDQGLVLVICTPPQGVELSTEAFNQAFPDWIATLQQRANEGLIARAHYLSELKAGVFIVVNGDDTNAAMQNAERISAEMNDIYNSIADADDAEQSETCRFQEIGPVAILPQ